LTTLQVKHLKRYKDFIWLLMKYGQLDMLKELESDLPSSDQAPLFHQGTPSPEDLVKDLQALGPAFIKLGQLLSTQTDLLPDAYAEALSKLQDRADPFPYQEVEKIIQEELGAKVRTIFEEFDSTPMAAASLAQVHRAVLPSQRVVAVKIQRPNIRKGIIEDLDVLDEIAHFLENRTSWAKRYNVVDKIRQLRLTLLNELDYKKEAINLATFKRNLRDFRNIIIPSPVPDYTTSHVLTMDFMEGQKITKLSPLTRMEIDGEELAQELFEAYLKQILLDGLVHIDPHPGNVYLSQDQRIILLDLGMVAHIGPQMQTGLLKLLLAISEGQGEEAADIIIRLGEKTEGYAYQRFREQIASFIAQYQDLNWSQLPIGRLLLKIAGLAADTGIILPPTFNMLGKALLNLDRAGKVVAPNFNPNEAIRQKAAELLDERMRRNFSWGFFYRIMLETTEFVQHLPSRLNDFLNILSKNELKIQVEAIDERYLMQGLEKIANRITLGLILAALIIGASQLMRVETTFTLWGYPGLAMLLFLGAALGGILLMINIFLSDEKRKAKKK
jgi:predicted unusual protein kinase regulating ubiquinone biosynthesis (AarF/ABC1/UbiB family)